jgi:hypothetical protein
MDTGQTRMMMYVTQDDEHRNIIMFWPLDLTVAREVFSIKRLKLQTRVQDGDFDERSRCRRFLLSLQYATTPGSGIPPFFRRTQNIDKLITFLN